jgi:2-dehydropantoate 2-reductase
MFSPLFMYAYLTQKRKENVLSMEIRTVSIVGLGALGILFGHHLSHRMPRENLRIIADAARIARYRRDGVYSNGEPCDFHYLTPDEDAGPSDLVIFAVKNNDLPDAIHAVRRQVGPATILMSLLNGISSEGTISRTYPAEQILYATAQGMDAVKVGHQLTYAHMGAIVFGDRVPGAPDMSGKTLRVAAFFDHMEIPHRIAIDMTRHQWGKFMLNAGVNQVIAVFGGNYGTVQHPGVARDTMVAAMREVIVLAEIEGVCLTESDISDWIRIVDGLDPGGKPSMSQDLEARRPSEVAFFSGTILQLAAKHCISTPVNRALYDRIREIESAFR